MNYKKKYCADDWGLTPGVNEGILELLKKDLIYSVSCIANSQYLTFKLSELLEIGKRYGVKFNLHFNLTFGAPLSEGITLVCDNGQSFWPLRSQFNNLLLKRANEGEILKEFNVQLNVLKELGVPISGIDGHHHMHLIPLVFQSIKDQLEKNDITDIRIVRDGEHWLTYVQGLFFEKFILTKKNKFNLRFCGYLRPSNIKNKSNYIKKTSRFKYLLIHPAKYNDFQLNRVNDELQQERVEEFNSILRFSP